MQEIDIGIILNLQRVLGNKFLDYFFYGVSFIGAEYFFLLIAVVLFLCVDKRFAFRLCGVFFLGQIVIGGLKNLIARPRPYDCGAKSVISKTDGYSFPSGHSHNIANLSTQMVLKTQKRYMLFTGIAVTTAVMLSRMYLGQHYLTDVIAGAALGIAIAIMLTELFKLLGNRDVWLFVVILPLTVLVMLLALFLANSPEDTVKVCGVYGAVCLGYFLEHRFVRYNVKSGGKVKQLIKILIGLALLLAIKEGLGYGFKALDIGEKAMLLLDYARYFLVGITATLALPLLFKKTKL